MYKKNCLQCESKKLKRFLNLGNQPWCNDFKKSFILSKKAKKYPLSVSYCESCYGAQLDFFINKEKMFSNHDYLSGINQELINHFKKLSKKIKLKFPNNKIERKNILDIGSNDGTFLSFFLGEWDILGIDSCKKTAKIANKRGIKTLNCFFNYDATKLINAEFDVIHASGIFFHLEELWSFTKGVKHLLKTKGIFVIQFLYLRDILEKKRYDQIYHEHIIYFTLRSLSILLARFDLEIHDSEHSNIHGGSMIVYVSHKGLKKKTARHLKNLATEKNFIDKKFLRLIRNFQAKVNKSSQAFTKKIKNVLKKKYKIVGIGAAAKTTVICNYANLNENDIHTILETNSLKYNKFVPGTGIKINNEKMINKKTLTKKRIIFLIFIWNFKKNIIQNLRKRFGKFTYFLSY